MILDATVGLQWLEHLVGHRVTRLSPGHVELQTPVVQIPIDITRNFQPQTVRKALRGALLLRPNSQKVGLIVHSNHQDDVEELGAGFSEKIHRISYFHSGEERSDNEWHAECDLILVCGTPRVPPAVIRLKLMQAGLIEAATASEPEFLEQDWLGTFVDGQRGVLRSKRYSDDQWHAAYLEQVHALLRQSVGRGRGLLADGVETFLFSKEPLGYPVLSLNELIQVSDDEIATLEVIRDLSAEFTNNNLLTNPAVKSENAITTLQIADRLNLACNTIRDRLRKLETLGLVERQGKGKSTAWKLPVGLKSLNMT